MCTQYTPTRPERLARHFGVRPPRDDYVEQAFPGHSAPILRIMAPAPAQPPVRSGAHPSMEPMACDLAVFGLIPHWSRDGRNFRHCYNARAETVAEKPSFRQAWRRGQWCLVPADAFYEPCYETGRAVRWRISPVEDAPLLLAGLWDLWQAPDGRPVLSFTLITQNADAHPLMSRFHPAQDEKRSVVRVDHADLPRWLRATQEQARALIQPLDARQLSAAADPAPQRRRDRATPGTPASPATSVVPPAPGTPSMSAAAATSATSAAPCAGAQLTLDALFADRGATDADSADADST